MQVRRKRTAQHLGKPIPGRPRMCWASARPFRAAGPMLQERRTPSCDSLTMYADTHSGDNAAAAGERGTVPAAAVHEKAMAEK